MLTTPLFWFWCSVVVSLGIALWHAAHKITDRYLIWRHRRNMRILRNNPHELKQVIRTKDRMIAHLEDELLKSQGVVARLTEGYEDQKKELKRLIGRNTILTNEVRCDDNAKTDILRHIWPARKV